MAFLRFDSGPQTGEKVPLDKDKVTFGRSKSCDCVLSHPTVSREHFYVERNNGKLFLVDQGSENGTRANTARVSWIELEDGDKVEAGPFAFVVDIADELDEPERSPSAVARSESLAEARDQSAFDVSTSGMYPPQYLRGIEHFNAGRYFDAHEIWEEIWLHSSGDTKVFYQMLIQAAVGLHHFERGNSRGARGMHANVVEKLNRLPSVFMSLDLAEFARSFNTALIELIEHNNETSPLVDNPRPQIRLLSNDSRDWDR